MAGAPQNYLAVMKVVGVGGGVVIVPLIVSACKSIPQRVVSGTSLAAVLSTALVSAATFAESGCVDPAAAAVISPVAMLTAPLGAKLTAKLNCTALRRTLGIFLLCVAPLVPLKAYLLSEKEQGLGKTGATGSGDRTAPVAVAAALQTSVADAAADVPPPAGISTILQPDFWKRLAADVRGMELSTVAALGATGGVAGLASGLLGIGGGTIVTPLLALLMPYGQATVLGTSLLSMVPPSAAALAQHTRMGNVDWRMALGLAAGTAVGGALGSGAAVQAPAGVLEGCFAVGMLFLGRKTLQSAR